MPLHIAEAIIMAKSKIIYQQRPSLLRVVTNYTPSIAIILIQFILSFQFFFDTIYQSNILFEFSILYIGLWVLELVLVYTEYRGTVFYIDEQKIYYRRFSQRKGITELAHGDIKNYYLASLNLVLENEKKERLVLDYLARPQILKIVIKEILEKKVFPKA